MNPPKRELPLRDLLDPFEEFAEHLNSIKKPKRRTQVFYDMMSGALVWRDETNRNTPIDVIWALGLVRSYRTSLMLNEPQSEIEFVWEYALSLFPDWVGFRSERRTPTPELLETYRRGDVSLRWCLRNTERDLDE